MDMSLMAPPFFAADANNNNNFMEMDFNENEANEKEEVIVTYD